MKEKDSAIPHFYISRELSWLEFNHRVLMQAEGGEGCNPLLERIKFISITASNLDEFFMVRVADARSRARSGHSESDAFGFTPRRLLQAIERRAESHIGDLYRIFDALREELLPHGVRIKNRCELDAEQRAFCDKYYRDNIKPLINPVILDGKRPLTLIGGGGLNLAMSLEKPDGHPALATVHLPTGITRLIKLPCPSGAYDFIPVEEIVREKIKPFFKGYKLKECRAYRILREGDLSVSEDDGAALLGAIKSSLKMRKTKSVIRLELEAGTSPRLAERLRRLFGLGKLETFDVPGIIDLRFLLKEIYPLPLLDGLRYNGFTPAVPEELRDITNSNIFRVISQKDILLHHPYQSFDPVVRFLRAASEDPQVVSIKITLYRVSDNSPIVAALAKAALAGKQVTAMVEARARFDEENNIEMGEELSRLGAEVIFGLPKLKIHSKIALVLRREEDGIKKYIHLGTGNYNETTARQYTDYSLLTADEIIGEDAVEFFRAVTAGDTDAALGSLIMAPTGLRQRLKREIRRQRELAREGKPAEILIKINALTDIKMAAQLCKASQDGVRIRLLVRGMCCLRPGVSGLSGDIEVRSIVGRFLEHSRVYIFGGGEDRRVFISSADMMPRNLDRRVELMIPVNDKGIRERLTRECELCWADNVKSMRLLPDGIYERVTDPENGADVCAQELLLAGDSGMPVTL